MPGRSSKYQKSSSQKGAEKPLSGGNRGRSKNRALPRGWLFNLWVFLTAILIGVIVWSYWGSNKDSLRPKEVRQEAKKDSQSGDARQDITETQSYRPNGLAAVDTRGDYPPEERKNSGDSRATPTVSTHNSSATLTKTTSPLKIRGQVSIIIDDMGGSLEMAKNFLELPYPIAFAVLPYEPYSREVAQLILRHGHVVLLHMPMEPHDYPKKNPGKGALVLSQDKETQRRLFLKALEQVPGAVGVNNHMGSRFTEDREAMGFFLQMVKEKDLFFVDSATSDKSVACDVAREIGVVCLRRNVFLDHEPSVSFISAQFVRLSDMAASRDMTIVIGHPHRVTLEVLRKKLVEIQAKHVELVSIDKFTASARGRFPE